MGGGGGGEKYSPPPQLCMFSPPKQQKEKQVHWLCTSVFLFKVLNQASHNFHALAQSVMMHKHCLHMCPGNQGNFDKVSRVLMPAWYAF